MQMLILTDDEATELRLSLRSSMLNTESSINLLGELMSPGVMEVWKHSQELRQTILDKLDGKVPTVPMTPQVAAYLKDRLRKLRDLRGIDFETAKLNFRQELSAFGLDVLSDENEDYYGVGLGE